MRNSVLHSWGNPDIDSDVDLLVVLPFHGKLWRVAVDIRERIKTALPLVLLVRPPSQLQERLALHDSFITDIVTLGKV